MSLILGFGGKEVKIDKTGESPYVADLSFFSSIFTYCNIVEAQMVGNVNAKLIKTAILYHTGDPVSFERGKVVVTLHFRKHTYFT
jgi:hypothetical protein